MEVALGIDDDLLLFVRCGCFFADAFVATGRRTSLPNEDEENARSGRGAMMLMLARAEAF